MDLFFKETRPCVSQLGFEPSTSGSTSCRCLNHLTNTYVGIGPIILMHAIGNPIHCAPQPIVELAVLSSQKYSSSFFQKMSADNQKYNRYEDEQSKEMYIPHLLYCLDACPINKKRIFFKMLDTLLQVIIRDCQVCLHLPSPSNTENTGL